MPPIAARVVHVIVPDAVDDPLRPSGGNRYDREVCDGLAAVGWRVHEHQLPEAWPRTGPAGIAALTRLLLQLPDRAVVVVDGLIAEAGAQVLVPAGRRLSIVVLVHSMPSALPGLRAVLAVARGVIATSGWLRDGLLACFPLEPEKVQVAIPGVAERPLAVGSCDGGELLCVGAIAPHKGQDVLLAALAALGDIGWRCRCVGSFEHDPGFADRLRSQVASGSMARRVCLAGPRTGPDLEACFAAADLLVHPAREEGYGMVVTEALAAGVPVLTSRVGGLPEALGTTSDGVTPGMLVPPGDPAALEGALRSWLTDARLRHRLRGAARARRAALPRWATTAAVIDATLGEFL